MCSGHVVPPPRAFAQTSSCAWRSSVTVKAIRVWRSMSPLRNAASSSGATVPSRIIFVTCRSLTPARDAISAAVMPLARSRAYASYWSAGCIGVALLVLVERHLGGVGAAAVDAARRDVPRGDLAGLGEPLQGGQPPAAGDHGEGVVAVGDHEEALEDAQREDARLQLLVVLGVGARRAHVGGRQRQALQGDVPVRVFHHFVCLVSSSLSRAFAASVRSRAASCVFETE